MNKTLTLLSALTLGTAALSFTAQADNAMSGMDMSSRKTAQKPKPAPFSVTATLNPAAPRTGDNALDLLVTDAAGKPMTGLKLTTSVAMASMNMGITHPAVTEVGGGHYTLKANFGMDGPWRVVIRNGGNKIAVLNFEAGSKTPWKSPTTKMPGAAVPPKAAPSAAMPGMDMGGSASGPADSNASTPDMADMSNMPDMKVLKTAPVPELQEKGTYIATGDEDWKAQAGFGHNAGMVGMMNQMMVGGSGMEGMKMPAMKMDFGEKNYTPATHDANAPMAGMEMGSSASVKITAVTASLPKSGDNPLTISLTDPQGKPVTGATISASVAMTSMDMGTTEPVVTEKGNGQYAAVVNFSMAGSWRVKVKVTPPGQKPQIKVFDFTAH